MTSTFEALLLAQVNALQNPPMFRMVQSAAQGIPNNTPTTVTMDTSQWDNYNGRSGTSPYSYTIPAGLSGKWDYKWGMGWNANTTGFRKMMVYKNGTVWQTAVFDTTNNTDTYAMIGSATIPCAAGDVMSVVVVQNCGGMLTAQVDGTFAPFFEGRLVSYTYP